ncbi:MAG: hypothetical protein Q9159_007720, partial [Coniocarpon cinnabarinum]
EARLADLWENYFIKHVAGLRPHISYIWDELTIFTHWRASSHLTILFFDVSPPLQQRFLSALKPHDDISITALQDPFTVLAKLYVVILDLQDESVWSIRDVVRSIEKERLNAPQDVQCDFPALHEAARHAIHSVETLETSESNIGSMLSLHRRLFLNRCNQKDKVSIVEEELRQQKSIFDALKQRAESNLKRVQNEISLAFNIVAQRDSQSSLLMTKAATRDSRAMRQIAVLTTIFLPGTFVANAPEAGYEEESNDIESSGEDVMSLDHVLSSSGTTRSSNSVSQILSSSF